MELANQPIHLLICMNANNCMISLYPASVLDLFTRNINRSAISCEDFTFFPLWKLRAEAPHMHLEFQHA